MSLKISIRTAKLLEASGDVVVIGVWAHGATKAKKATRAAVDPLAPIERAMGGGLARVMAKEEFKGKRDQQLRVPTLGKVPGDAIVLIGLGDPGSMTDAEARAFAGKAARAANAEK